MRNDAVSISVLAPVTLLLLVAGCENLPVGQKCSIGVLDVDAGRTGTSIIASPALDCPTRLCLHTPQERELPQGSEYANLCTDFCSSDDDCEKASVSRCQLGFACGVATTTGPFCCQKMCICKDYIVIPDAGLQVPAACDPTNPTNTCANLER